MNATSAAARHFSSVSSQSLHNGSAAGCRPCLGNALFNASNSNVGNGKCPNFRHQFLAQLARFGSHVVQSFSCWCNCSIQCDFDSFSCIGDGFNAASLSLHLAFKMFDSAIRTQHSPLVNGALTLLRATGAPRRLRAPHPRVPALASARFHQLGFVALLDKQISFHRQECANEILQLLNIALPLQCGRPRLWSFFFLSIHSFLAVPPLVAHYRERILMFRPPANERRSVTFRVSVSHKCLLIASRRSFGRAIPEVSQTRKLSWRRRFPRQLVAGPSHG